ncbi:MAG: oligosaccharide flippase family protein [Bacteroidales bacterium]|jgi:O-antigen/teichoic acid export membrane protein|nr:oligosaccharide flippase family protein [Bacteroidales bacterium]
MKLNLKEYFKLSAIYIVVAALPPGLQLIIQPIIEGPNRLGPVDFSQLAVSELVTSLVFTVALFSMGNAIARFYYEHKDRQSGYHKMVSTVMNSILFRGLILLGVGWLFKDYIGQVFSQPALQDFESYGFLAMIIGINRAIAMTAATLYRNEKKVRRFILLNVGLGILRAGFQVIGVFYYDMSFIGFLWGGAIGSSITSITVMVYTWYSCGFRFNMNMMKELNQFAFPLFQFAIILWGINYAERFFLESKPVDLGIYGVAVGLALGFEKILIGIQSATQPEIYRFMDAGMEEHEGDIKKLSNLMMAQTQVLIAMAIIPAMLYLTLFYTTDVRLAYGLITIIFIKFIVRTQFLVFSYGVYFRKKTIYFLYVNSFALVANLGLNYLLVPVLSFYGVIIAMYISLSIQSIAFYFINRKLTGIRWNNKKMLFYPFAIVLLTGLLEYLKVEAGLNPYLTSSLVVLLIIMSLAILYKTEIRQIFIKYLR